MPFLNIEKERWRREEAQAGLITFFICCNSLPGRNLSSKVFNAFFRDSKGLQTACSLGYNSLSVPFPLTEAQRQVKVKILVNNKFPQGESTLCSNASSPSFFSKDLSYLNSWYMFKFYNFYRAAHYGEKSVSTFLHTDSVCCQLAFGQFNP